MNIVAFMVKSLSFLTKQQIENLLLRLQGMEWRKHYVDNGPDEYRCPGYCVHPLVRNIEPTFPLTHDADCDYGISIKELQIALDKE